MRKALYNLLFTFFVVVFPRAQARTVLSPLFVYQPAAPPIVRCILIMSMKENVRHEIGCPGELVYTASDIHHRHAYIGSHPLFPRANGEVVLPQEKLLTCTRCKNPLYLTFYVSVQTVKSTNILSLDGFLLRAFRSLCLFPSFLNTRFLLGNALCCISSRALKRVAVMRSSVGKHYGIP